MKGREPLPPTCRSAAHSLHSDPMRSMHAPCSRCSSLCHITGLCTSASQYRASSSFASSHAPLTLHVSAIQSDSDVQPHVTTCSAQRQTHYRRLARLSASRCLCCAALGSTRLMPVARLRWNGVRRAPGRSARAALDTAPMVNCSPSSGGRPGGGAAAAAAPLARERSLPGAAGPSTPRAAERRKLDALRGAPRAHESTVHTSR